MKELSLLDTQKAIKDCKDTFISELSSALNLSRVSAPLFVLKDSGLNDNLNGVERPVAFDIKQRNTAEQHTATDKFYFMRLQDLCALCFAVSARK